MLSLKGILSVLLGLYLVGLVVVLKQGRFTRELPAEMNDLELAEIAMELSDAQEDWDSSIAVPTYEFTDKALAYKILSQLDVFEIMTEKQLLNFKLNARWNETIYGFKPEDDYCDRHRAYFVEYPESIFQEINVVLGRENDSWVTVHAINGFANDVHPNNHNLLPKRLRENPITPIKVYANVFFTTPHMYDKIHFAKHFSCLSQTSNHIPGSATLSRKDLVAESATEYLKKYETRPQCINYDKFFPETWRLQKKDECLQFFARFNSEEYRRLQQERRIVYIKKITGLHKGEGVQPLTPEEEVLLREEYQNGTLCGKVRNNTLMQHYVYNPLLINGRKFDFRMYMLVASTDPLIVYYHDGNLRVSLGNYTAETDDKKTLLTNIALNKEIYDSARNGDLYEGMSLDELAYHQQWSFQRLHEYLMQKNIVTDPNWLDNYLRPEFKKAMVHLTRMSFKNYLKTSRIYELYGVDFMLDENLNLWFIEANSGPAIKGLPQYLAKQVSKMVQDHFRIEFALLRSRMKRVIQYVNSIIAEDGDVIEKTGVIPNLAQRREVFDALNRNAFEKEFEIGPENGFYKIVDESLEGVDRYQGWITEECL